MYIMSVHICADKTSIEYVYNVCAYMPLLGLVTFFLPNLKKQKTA